MEANDKLLDRRSSDYSVYILRDPDTQTVRYVGCSCNTHDRKRAHLTAHKGRNYNRLTAWLKSLADAGKEPLFEVVARITGRGLVAEVAARRAERDVISWYSWRSKELLLNVQHNSWELRTSRNKWRSRQITVGGKTQCMSAWAREVGITRERMRQRLEKYPPTVAVTTPKGESPVLT